MEYSFEVKMKAKYLIQFLFRHYYWKIGGVVRILLSIFAGIYGVLYWGSLSDLGRFGCILMAAAYTIIQPLQLCHNGIKQMKKIPAFHQILAYKINEEGITTTQEEQSVLTPWDHFRRVVKTRNQVLVYTSTVSAFLFPYECMGEHSDEIVAYIKEHIV